MNKEIVESKKFCPFVIRTCNKNCALWETKSRRQADEGGCSIKDVCRSLVDLADYFKRDLNSRRFRK